MTSSLDINASLLDPAHQVRGLEGLTSELEGLTSEEMEASVELKAPPGASGDSVEERILRSLRRITRAIDLHSKQLVVGCKMTAPQLICLRELRAAVSMTPSELARAVTLSQATITGILDRLEARGLVHRARDPRDKRRVNVELTDEGREAVDSAPLPLQARFADQLAKLDPAERTEIERVLARIVRMMEAEAIDAAAMLVGGSMSDDPDEVKTTDI